MPQHPMFTQKLSPALAHQVLTHGSQKTSQVIIETMGLRADRILAFVEANHGKVEKEIRLIPGIAATLPNAFIADLVRYPQVAKVWEDSQVRVLADEASPVYGGVLPQEYPYTGKGVTVGVLDTGIYPHEDLTSPENRILAWNDLIGEKTAPYDDHGHGTHVAGVIAGNGRASHGRYKGVASEARLVGVKVLDQTGRGRLADLLLGLEWCLANLKTLKIRVINLSLGTRSQGLRDRDPLIRATTLAWKNGIVICSATGKAGMEYLYTKSPGANDKIITVGNLDFEKTLTNEDERLLQGLQPEEQRLNHFTVPDLVAAGNNLVAVKVDGGYCSYNGPSTAAALVSGATALILEKWPVLKPEQVKWLLTRKTGDCGLGLQLQGGGVLDLDKILGKPSKTNASQNQAGQMIGNLMKSALNLFSKSASGSPIKINDLLLIALPLLNQFLNRREA
ncbi:MAG TPA: S8 family peptidase [Bacillota bacterium]|nr:S8 family peptidase [Bacillota bacterium]